MCVHEELRTSGGGGGGGESGGGKVPRSESAFSIECSMANSAALTALQGPLIRLLCSINRLLRSKMLTLFS